VIGEIDLIELDRVLGMIHPDDSSSSQTVSTLIPVLDLPRCSLQANNTFPVVPGLISSDGVSDETGGIKDSEVSKWNAASLSSLPRAVPCRA
jgi:hypothetical protein